MKRFITSPFAAAGGVVVTFAVILVFYFRSYHPEIASPTSAEYTSITPAGVESVSAEGPSPADKTTASKSSRIDLNDLFRKAAGLSHNEARILLQARLSGLSEEESKNAITQLMTDPKLAELQDLVVAASGSWMERDPGAFLTWVRQSFDDEKASQVLLFSVKNLASSHANAFWTAITQEWKEEQTRFVSPIAAALAERNPAEAFATVTDLFSNPAHRQEARMAVIEKWGLTAPQDALAAIQTLSPEEGRDGLAATIFAAWNDSDPAAVESFLASSAIPLSLRQSGVAVVTEMRATRDPIAASEWLASLPPETVGADALVNLSQNLSFTDHARAMQVAAQIQEPSLRALQISELYSSWAREDPASAQSYLQQHPLPDQREQQRLISEMSPNQAGLGD